ncbi:hypothetical protein HHI36_003176 [Cryptolaemus montrouzieri]|uniref:Uncharacterized protein n=1 Tax=Cryptolaemus montrouzieri TaxID=559131 RepID=A0ABD2PDM2_9CUCU
MKADYPSHKIVVMIMIIGECKCNSSIAVIRYAECFPDIRHPTDMILRSHSEDALKQRECVATILANVCVDFDKVKLQEQLRRLYYDEIKVELKALKGEVNDLKKDSLVSPDALVAEINDRDSRSNNLMIYNLKESDSTRVEHRKRDDVGMVNAIINESTNGVSDVDVTSNNIVKVLRVGQNVLKNKANIKNPAPYLNIYYHNAGGLRTRLEVFKNADYDIVIVKIFLTDEWLDGSHRDLYVSHCDAHENIYLENRDAKFVL